MGKQKILQILAQNNGGFVSGEALAQTLGQSRAAVWKGIQALRAEGYPIESRHGLGYCLEAGADLLLESEIRACLRTQRLGSAIQLLPSVDSTSTFLRRLAFEGAPEGTLVAADHQTAGKGRLGRSFHSPTRNGIYMSVLLRPRLPFEKIHFLTMLTAVCVTDAIASVTGADAQIKWVNDILLNGCKLCGILTEAAVEGESGTLSFAVVGIGINVGSVQNFPELSGNRPAALRDFSTRPFTRNELIAEICGNLERYYYPYLETQDSAPFLGRYRERLCLAGKQVRVVQGSAEYRALVLGVADSGGLLVQREDGSRTELTSGEVSIRENFAEE